MKKNQEDFLDKGVYLSGLYLERKVYILLYSLTNKSWIV